MNNLEQQMQQFEKTMGLLIETGLNWEIKKEQFTHPTGLITDHYGIFRYDHGSDTPTSCLGSVKGRYTELSNFDLADTIVKATASLNIDTNQLNAGLPYLIHTTARLQSLSALPILWWLVRTHSTLHTKRVASSDIRYQARNVLTKQS